MLDIDDIEVPLNYIKQAKWAIISNGINSKTNRCTTENKLQTVSDDLQQKSIFLVKKILPTQPDSHPPMVEMYQQASGPL